jgi:cobyric acid synthase
LKEAADILSQSPCAMQLRYLQTLNGIATEQNSTIVFPLPVDLLSLFQKSQIDSNPFLLKPSTKTDNIITSKGIIMSSPTATDI